MNQAELARAALTPFEVIESAWWRPLWPTHARYSRVEVRRALRAAVLQKWAPETPGCIGDTVCDPTLLGLTPLLAKQIAPILAAGMQQGSLRGLLRGADVREVRACWGADVVDGALALPTPPLGVAAVPTPWRLLGAAQLEAIGLRLLLAAIAQLPARWAARLRLRLPPNAAVCLPENCPAALVEALAGCDAAAAAARGAWWSWVGQAMRWSAVAAR